MKSFWIIVVCLYVSQVYSGGILNKYFRTPSSWTEASDDQIEHLLTRFRSIRNIHSETIVDINAVLREFRQNYSIFKFFGEVYEVLWKDLRGRDSIVTTNDVIQFLDKIKKEKEVFTKNDTVDMGNEIEQILSEKLNPDQVNRIMTIARIFEGNPTTIDKALFYLYNGSLPETTTHL